MGAQLYKSHRRDRAVRAEILQSDEGRPTGWGCLAHVPVDGAPIQRNESPAGARLALTVPRFTWSWLTPEWITAIATSATALLTLLSMAYAAWRRRRDRLPLIEVRQLELRRDGTFVFRLTIRNRLTETIALEEVRISRPRGAPVRGAGNAQQFVSALRMTERAPPASDDADAKDIMLWMKPPLGWQGGKVAFELRVSSLASTIRSRWIKGTTSVSLK
jgi:hypothetical protein